MNDGLRIEARLSPTPIEPVVDAALSRSANATAGFGVSCLGLRSNAGARALSAE
jgi:hypothetical protein